MFVCARLSTLFSCFLVPFFIESTRQLSVMIFDCVIEYLYNNYCLYYIIVYPILIDSIILLRAQYPRIVRSAGMLDSVSGRTWRGQHTIETRVRKRSRTWVSIVYCPLYIRPRSESNIWPLDQSVSISVSMTYHLLITTNG